MASGNTLELNNVTITDEFLTLNGVGFGNRGALVGLTGTTSTWEQAAAPGQLVNIATASTIGVDTGATIDIDAACHPVDASQLQRNNHRVRR